MSRALYGVFPGLRTCRGAPGIRRYAAQAFGMSPPTGVEQPIGNSERGECVKGNAC
jgi:hypothetical protein